MTKDVFNAKFESAYKNALKEYMDISAMKNSLRKYSGENTKLSFEDMAVFAFNESIKINAKIMKSVLEDVLQFDD